jgi:acyl carrier protein
MEKLISIIEESLYGIDPGTVSEDSNIVQLKEWDSLALLSLTDSIDMEFGVLLKKGDIEGAQSVAELWQLIELKQKK